MILPDTQAVLWALIDSPRLGRRARASLAASGAFVSAATVFEVTVKKLLGKLDAPDDLRTKLIDRGFVELPITAEHAEAVARYPQLVRHDPFDRLLVAQASVENLTLLTADQVLLGLGLDFVSDARE